MSVRARVSAHSLAPRWTRALAAIADTVFLVPLWDLSIRISTSSVRADDFAALERMVRLGPSSLSSSVVERTALPFSIMFWQLFLLTFVYFTLFEGLGKRATPGKLLFSLNVADLRGFPVTLVRSFGRNVARFFVPLLCFAVTVGAMFYLWSNNTGAQEQGRALLNSMYFSSILTAGGVFISLICIVVSRRRQTLYDLLADTVVVTEDDRVLFGAVLGLLAGGSMAAITFAIRTFLKL